MSTSVLQSKKRINSIKSIEKITNAMKLVSIAKLKTISNRLSGQDIFSSKLDLIMSKLTLLGDDIDSVYFNEIDNNITSKKLYIVITSDLGLCGSYNYNIFNYLDENIINDENAYFIILGNKGLNHYQNKNINFDEEFLSTSIDDINKTSSKVKDYILRAFLNKKYAEVHLIYTKYVNSLTFRCTDKKLLPLTLNLKEDDTRYKEVEPIIQPNKNQIIDTFIPLYVESLLYAYILNSLVSEYTSRRNAMEQASDNANELLEKLTIQYNKARQESITNEIIEVVSAFNNV